MAAFNIYLPLSISQMKKIPLNEMERVQGGSLSTMCYGVGALTILSLQSPFSLYIMAPAIKYCWNH